jgi:hypothetical protein
MTKGVYKFQVDFGRMGNIGGIFIADAADVQWVIGKKVDFGECLGKHSDVQCLIEEHQIWVLSIEQDFITKLEDVLGTGTISGYNPFDYISREDFSDDND